MNWAPSNEPLTKDEIRVAVKRGTYPPGMYLIPPTRRDRLTELTILFWLGFSVASVLYTVAGLVYFLAL